MAEEFRIVWILAIGLGLACAFGYIAQKAKQSPIIGYLIAGYLLGPNSPGLVVDTKISDQLASIGVALLMFAVGLNFNWRDLIAVKKIVVPGAMIVSALSIMAGLFYSVHLGETVSAGLVVGLAICVSSTVVIVRVLADQGILNTQQGHIVVGWTIVEDLISVFGLLLLPSLAKISKSADTQLWIFVSPILLVLLKIILLFILFYFFCNRLIELILKVIARERSHELFTLAILSIAFSIAIVSSYIFGVSLALGAFLAGTTVGRTEMSHQAAANALPMKDAFAVIFFLSVGMLFNPSIVLNNLPLFFGILAILLLVRPLLAYLFMRATYRSAVAAFAVAFAIAQIGEYSFILAEEGNNLGILPDNAFDILVACAFVTIGVNPILFHLFGPLCRRYSKDNSQSIPKDLLQEQQSGKISLIDRVVLVGFGPVGQEACKYLLKKAYRVLVVDQNIDTISSLQGYEIETIFGDAAQFHILEQAHIEQACLVVITIPDNAASLAVIQAVRSISPSVPIIAREHFKAEPRSSRAGNISYFCDEEAASEKLISIIRWRLKES